MTRRNNYGLDRDDVVEMLEHGLEWDMVEREGHDIRFDRNGRSFWLRATNDDGWDAEGVADKNIATCLRSLGFAPGKASEGCHHWRP